MLTPSSVPSDTIITPICIDSVRHATHVLSLDLEIGSVLASVHVRTRITCVYRDPDDRDEDEEDSEVRAHKVAVSSAVDDVKLKVSAPKKCLEPEGTSTGQIRINKGVRIEAKSANSDADVILSDKFLGEVEVKSTLKRACVYEPTTS
ncbi:hypothetical protein BGZ93_006628 [Podila epicladia]|nr:hypothetical protein BGZ93_006628 [Podila epicladia]